MNRISIVALAIVSAWPSLAFAADKPIVGAAPDWVRPVTWPMSQDEADRADVRLILQDNQVAFEREKQTVYSEVALRVQTAQGLAAGNISIPWRPDTDILTVHKLHILRGDTVIDVLGAGQTFTVVRREANLENAALDGVLTANIQPEGLQVGDVINFAVSITSSDPVMKGHVEELGGTWNVVPITRAHLRAQWPSLLPVRVRQVGDLPQLKPVKSGGLTSIELSLNNIEPLNLPKGAPRRFGVGRLVELTDFSSWAEMASLLAPLYQKASALPTDGRLQAEVARIRALSPDPKVRTEAALALVQNRIRYVFLAMGEGGLVPADAETTWSRRFGDCKAKTAMLLGLLDGLGIKAEPVAVSSIFGDGLDARLPMIGLFDHVLVRATVNGRTYWLDGTRLGDTSLDRLTIPTFGWGLPLVQSGAVLVRMLPAPLELPTQHVTITMDATAGLSEPAPTRIEMLMRGDAAIATNNGLANLTSDARDRALREYWRGQYDFIDVKSTSAVFDADKGEIRLLLEGSARMDWSNGTYETDGTSVGYKADFSRDPGPGQDAPFAVPYPYYTSNVETIMLPPGFAGAKVGSKGEVSQTTAGIEYRRHVTLEGNVFRVEKSERSIAPEFPAAEAPAAQIALRDLFDRTVYIRRPSNYRMTDKEVEAALRATPSDADGFVRRGTSMMNVEKYDEAIADFDQALKLDSKNIWALADRGISYAWKGDTAAATKDLDAAATLDPRNLIVFHGRGLVAQRNNDPKTAIATYTKALEIYPSSGFALGHRAEAYHEIGDDEHALADAAAATKLNSRWIDMYLLRVNILRTKGEREKVLAEAAALTEANPDDAYAHVVAARIYQVYGQSIDMAREYDRALALKPEAYIYLNRSQSRPKEDVAGRSADIDAALKLNPTMLEALNEKATLLQDAGDIDGAIDIWSAAIKSSSERSDLLANRGIAYVKQGLQTLADKDFADARSMAKDAAALNNLCWEKATAGVALDSALADCDAALAKSPDVAGILDSRGLVLLRLGRIDEAIAEYDRALAKSQNNSSSLFGRAIAWSRKGDKAKSDADATAARNADADIDATFEKYGLKR